jgi:hypothetical protein
MKTETLIVQEYLQSCQRQITALQGKERRRILARKQVGWSGKLRRLRRRLDHLRYSLQSLLDLEDLAW